MRDESGRVAARVRALLGADDASSDPADGPDGPSDEPSPNASSRWAALRARHAGRWRLDPGRRAAMAVGAGVLVAAVATGAWVVAERPRSVAVTASPAGAAPTAASRIGLDASASAAAPHDRGGTSTGGRVGVPGSSSSAGSPSASDEVVVDVAGKVRRPGLYRLPVGARVDDAVRAAGGALSEVNVSSLNLAAKVADGAQIRVGLPGPAVVPAPDPAIGSSANDASGGGGSSAGPVNLNTATSDQLQSLPGVGPVLAQHIIDWRSAHGRFESVDRLNDVPGIGEVKFAALRSRVTV